MHGHYSYIGTYIYTYIYIAYDTLPGPLINVLQKQQLFLSTAISLSLKVYSVIRSTYSYGWIN